MDSGLQRRNNEFGVAPIGSSYVNSIDRSGLKDGVELLIRVEVRNVVLVADLAPPSPDQN